LLAAEGYREVIVTGRSLARIQETAAQLATVFPPLELDTPASVQSTLAELVKRGRRVDLLLLNAGMVPGKKRVLTAACRGGSGHVERPPSTDCRIAPFPK